MVDGSPMPRTIQEVKARHQDRLLALPGIVSVGIGQNPDGKPVIIIGLERQHHRTKARLPETLDGYAVRVDIIGQIKAQ